MNKKKSTYWKTCDLPAKLFFDILESGNVKLLQIKGKTGKTKLQKTFDGIFDEYVKLRNDPKTRLILKTKLEVIKLFRKVTIIKKVIEALVKYKLPKDQIVEIVEKLNKLGVKINLKNNLNKELLNALQYKIKGLETRLEIEKDNLKGFESKEKSSFEENCANLELVGWKIDENVSLKRYLAYEKIALKKAKKNKV